MALIVTSVDASGRRRSQGTSPTALLAFQNHYTFGKSLARAAVIKPPLAFALKMRIHLRDCGKNSIPCCAVTYTNWASEMNLE
jgi:hypothetical protein